MFKDVPPRRQYGQGSGVIVSSDGYIITNNHVVADAVDVEVILADRRQFKAAWWRPIRKPMSRW